jgi:anti-sigma factor RsiW
MEARPIMNCGQVRQLLDAWLDNELDTSTSADMALHVRECPDCVALQVEREDLRTRIRAEAPRFEAPPGLRRAVRQALRQVPLTAVPRRRGPTWWQAFALAGFTGLACGLLTWLALDGALPSSERLREELVARHVAALAGPLTGIASSDRHAVKPWFHGKVSFAPEVCDRTSHGFVLKGARVERIGGAMAAAVVYQIRNHPIDLFVWPAADATSRAVEIARARGFAIATWSADGLNFAAISDVDPRDLERFAREGCGTH